MNQKKKIMVVDDSEMNRSILADILSEEYDIVEADDGEQAIDKLKACADEIALVLLDMVMPVMNGLQVLEIMNGYSWIETIPVIMISAENVSDYVDKAFALGATDYIVRPFDSLIVQRRVANTIAFYAKQNKLINLVSDQIYERERNNDLMVAILSHIVEFRNGESGLHVLHIRKLTEMLLIALMSDEKCPYRFTPEDVDKISMASALHDIGKISIPDEILNKPGKLTAEEFAIMKTHAAEGAKILKNLSSFYREEPLVQRAYEIARWHHERYDGKGYPDGLVGDAIPISAQIVSLADVYDALTSKRVYKDAYSPEKSIEMIMNGECGVFNPILLRCLKKIAPDIPGRLSDSEHSGWIQRVNLSKNAARGKELPVSDRTLRLLEDERIKMQFFASLSKELPFEYNYASSVLTFSEFSANKLGVASVIVDPLHNDMLCSLSSAAARRKIKELADAATPQETLFSFDLKVKMDRKVRWQRLICRVLFSKDKHPVRIGLIGKLQDVHEERIEMLRLQYKASHDTLTELDNRNYAQEKIVNKLMTSPADRNFIMIIVDVDYFKLANDNYGHAFGDRVLKYMANILRQSVRKEDITARIGGDEFMVFMEYTSDMTAQVERIFHSMLGELDDFQLSVSMGIAGTAQTGRNYETLFHRADQALYAAKNAGRGRYRFYDDSMKDNLTVGPKH